MYPGLFTYRELVDLDARVLMYWTRQAKILHLTNFIHAMQASRASQMENNKFRMTVEELQSRIREMEIGKARMVQDNWEFMRTKGRG